MWLLDGPGDLHDLSSRRFRGYDLYSNAINVLHHVSQGSASSTLVQASIRECTLRFRFTRQARGRRPAVARADHNGL